MFFRPASYYLPPLRRKIAGIDTWANRIVYGCFTRETDRANKPDPYSPGRLGWFLVGGYGMALLYGGLRIIGEARRRRSLSAESAFLFFFVFTVIYTGVIGNAMEFGENMRFRYPLDGLCLAVVAMAVRDWLFRVRRGDKRIGAGEPE